MIPRVRPARQPDCRRDRRRSPPCRSRRLRRIRSGRPECGLHPALPPRPFDTTRSAPRRRHRWPASNRARGSGCPCLKSERPDPARSGAGVCRIPRTGWPARRCSRDGGQARGYGSDYSGRGIASGRKGFRQQPTAQ